MTVSDPKYGLLGTIRRRKGGWVAHSPKGELIATTKTRKLAVLWLYLAREASA